MKFFARFLKRLPALQSVEISLNRNINSGLEQEVTLQPYDWISVQNDRGMTGAGHGNDELMDSRQKDHGNDGILDSRPTDCGNDGVG